MAWYSPFTRRFYLRIWLVVAGSVVALSLILGLVWHFSEQVLLQQRFVCQVEVLDAKGAVVSSEIDPMRHLSDGGLEFETGADGTGQGSRFTVQVKPRISDGMQDIWWKWLRPPYDFWCALALAGVIVMACVFPLVRQLTRRLEILQRGVEQWGQGDLSMRFPESRDDEVAYLMRHFNAAADRIVTLMQSHKSLLAQASHELRSPLARIRMAMELMPDPDTAGTGARTEILRNLSELDDLIEEILLASRMEAQFGAYKSEPVDLIGLLAEECARMGATLDIASDIVADPASAIVPGSQRLLRRAVRNLLENAVRHGKRADGQCENSVLIEHESANQSILIHVDDRGRGVPPDQRERIFEPFYRLPGTGEGGFGLGLVLVRMVAQQHGGSVICGDHAGGGTRFTLRLPCSAEPRTA